MKPLPPRHLLKLPSIALAVVIFALSAQSTLPQPKGIFGWDKFQHLAAYLVLTVTIGLWFAPKTWREKGLLAFLVTVVIGSLYGVTDEVHQHFVPGRFPSVWDWIADTLGALIGAGGLLLTERWWGRRRQSAG
jgi:VanZ family protein